MVRSVQSTNHGPLPFQVVFSLSFNLLLCEVGTNIRKPTVDYTDEDYSFLMKTNLESMFELTKACHPYLTRPAGQPTSSVVHIGSVAGVTCMKSGTLYAMTKAAMNQLTGNLACEWGPDGVRVNCVAPWYINTPLAKQGEAAPRGVCLVSCWICVTHCMLS